MRLHWQVGARSDVGLAREGNEDSLYAGPRLIAVADGVGGSVAGEIASSMAIASLETLDQLASIDEPLGALRAAILEANDGLRDAVARAPELTGMGTTLTALLWSDDALGLAQLGDSRGYLLRANEFTQITRDQTLVQSLVDDGEITPEEALTHPRRSWILQALDGRPDTDPELTVLDPQVGDRYLLCSDGLSDYVAQHDIVSALEVSDPQAACDRLIDLALAVGAPDNVTCVIADLVESGPTLEVPIVGGAAESAPQPPEHPTATGAVTVPLSPAPGPGSSAGSTPTSHRASTDREPRRPGERSIGRRLAVVAVAVLVIIAAIVGGGAFYIHNQWYVTTANGKVAVYQGVKGNAAGLHLSHLHTRTDLPASALPQDDRQRVASGIQVGGQGDAQNVVANLRAAACNLTTTSPSPAPTASEPPSISPSPGASLRPATKTARTTKPANPTPSGGASISAKIPKPSWCVGAQ